MIIVQVIFWVLFMYGFLSLVQDIATEFTYKKYNKHVKVFVCVDDFENEIENFERELSRVKGQFKNISINVVNMDEAVSDAEVNNFFEDSNIEVYSKNEFFNFIDDKANLTK